VQDLLYEDYSERLKKQEEALKQKDAAQKYNITQAQSSLLSSTSHKYLIQKFTKEIV
jgi:hypothetical protein